jgi:hypothetical protein
MHFCMHLRTEYVCLSVCLSLTDTGNFKLECCYFAFLMRMHVEKIAKNRSHFVKARPSILVQQLSTTKNVVFWIVTPFSLIDDLTWFRENVSLKWEEGSAETSTHICIVFVVSIEFPNTRCDFLRILLTI